MPQDTRTQSRAFARPVGWRARSARVFVDLFTKHPVAKIFALVLGSIVFALIDRQLRESIFDETMTLVPQATGEEKHEIVVRLPTNYMFLPGEKPVTTRVVIKGQRKDRGTHGLPFQANIPLERVIALSQTADGVALVALEARDISVPNLVDPELEITSTTFQVAEQVTVEAELKPNPRARVPDGHDAVITFTPPKISLTGPRPELEEMKKPIYVDVELPAPDKGPLEKQKEPELPPDFSKKLIKRADNGPITYTAELKRKTTSEWTPRPLRIRIIVSRTSKNEYEFLAPHDTDTYPAITFIGATQDIEAAKAAQQEVESTLTVHVPVERVLEQHKEEFDKLEPGTWSRPFDAPATIPIESLSRFKLQLKSNLLVRFKVRKRG